MAVAAAAEALSSALSLLWLLVLAVAVAVTLGQRDTLGLLLAEAVPELPPVRLELELGEAVEQALAVAVALAHRVPVLDGLPAPPALCPAEGLALVLAVGEAVSLPPLRPPAATAAAAVAVAGIV